MQTLVTALGGLIEAVAFLIASIFLMRIAKPLGWALTAYALRLSDKRVASVAEQLQHLNPEKRGKLTASKKRNSR